MNHNSFYPLKFDPIYQYRLWGGRRLAHLLSKPLPNDEAIGEAWLLSDRKDHASLVVDGVLKGYTLTRLLQEFPEEIMGKRSQPANRFPLLLKFLDCKEVLSVQVHPSDNQKQYIPAGDTGKTEAWVVLEISPESCIYAGLKPDTNPENLLEAITNHTIANKLHSFAPQVGDAVFIQSGTVHTLGGAVVFEVQENSDVTFRLYDWDRLDAKTNKHRELQVEKAIACIDFNQINIGPVLPVPDPHQPSIKERLFNCGHFALWRIKSDSAFRVGKKGEPRVLVCIDGQGEFTHDETNYPMNKGDVFLLPACVGECVYQPKEMNTLLEIAMPVESR